MMNLPLGYTQGGRPICWDFESSAAGNRHLLLTSCSGSGKSYLMRRLLQQVSAAGHAVFILDLTGEYKSAFSSECNVEILDPVYTPFGVSGFHLPPEGTRPQHRVRQRERIATLISECFSLSAKQHHLLYTAALQYLSQVEGASSMQGFLRYFLSHAETLKNDAAQPTINNRYWIRTFSQHRLCLGI